MAARLIGHKLAYGTKTVAEMGSVALLTAWTRQSDMRANNNWLPPTYAPISGDPSTPPEFPARGQALSGVIREDGFYTSKWFFENLWTFGMWGYFEDTFSPTGLPYAPVTMLTYTKRNVAVYLTATLEIPRVSKGTLAQVPTGFYPIIFNYTYGSIIT